MMDSLSLSNRRSSFASKYKLAALVLLFQSSISNAFTIPSLPTIGSTSTSFNSPIYNAATSSSSSSSSPVVFPHAQVPFLQLKRPSLSLNFQTTYADTPLSPLPDSSDPYIILNVSPHSSKEEIKRAYRRAAIQYHPDIRTNAASTDDERQSANDDFARINAAYAFLTGRSDRPTAAKQANARRSRAGAKAYAGYGGTSSAYTKHTRPSGASPNPSRYAQSGTQSSDTNGKSRPGRSTQQHTRRSYGGTGSTQARSNEESSNPSRYTQSVPNNAQSQTKRTSGTSPKYSSRGYGGTTSAYAGKQGTRHSQASGTSDTKAVQTQTKRTSGTSTKFSRKGYGGTTSAYAGKYGSRSTSEEDSTPSRYTPEPPTVNTQTKHTSGTSSKGYGGTTSAYAGKYGSRSASEEDSTPSRYTPEPPSATQSQTKRPMKTRTKYYSRQGYGGTTSAYAGKQGTRHSRPSGSSDTHPSYTQSNDSEESSSPSRYTQSEVKNTAKSPQTKRPMGTSSKYYSRQGYGGTTSAYAGKQGTRYSQASGTSDAKTGQTPTRRPSGIKTKFYSRQGYGGTTSAYPGKQGTGYSQANGTANGASNTKTVHASSKSKSRPKPRVNFSHGGYGGTTSAYGSNVSTSSPTSAGTSTSTGTSDTHTENTYGSSVSSNNVHVRANTNGSVHTQPNHSKTEKEKKPGDFFDANSFHAQWNAGNKSGSQSSGTGAHTSTGRKWGDFFNQGQSYSHYEENPTSDVNDHASTTSSKNDKASNFHDANQFHRKWNSSRNDSDNKSTTGKSTEKPVENARSRAEEQERLHNEAVIEAARVRAEQITAELKAKEAKKKNEAHVGSFANGFSMAVKSVTDLFTPPPPPKKTTSVPPPPKGQQFSPFEACSIIERHEKDISLDKPKAMRIMLRDHYVPVKRTQLYAVYRKYKEGKISRDNRWGQYL